MTQDELIEIGLAAAEHEVAAATFGEDGVKQGFTFNSSFTEDFKERFRVIHRAALNAVIPALAALREAPVPSEEPVATVRVTHKGYGMELSTHVAYALPEGMHDLFASPAVAPVAVSVKGLDDVWLPDPIKANEIWQLVYDSLDLSEELRVECADEVSGAIARTFSSPAASIIPATKGGEDKMKSIRELVDLVAAEMMGESTTEDGDDEPVGWTTDGPLPMTFGHIRRAQKALAALAQDTVATPPSDTEEKAL